MKTLKNIPFTPYPKAPEWRLALVVVGKGKAAPHPGSTKHEIYGPCAVVYETGPSGAIRGILYEDAEQARECHPWTPDPVYI